MEAGLKSCCYENVEGGKHVTLGPPHWVFQHGDLLTTRRKANTSERHSPEAHTASFMLLKLPVNTRLPLCRGVEKACLCERRGGVFDQLLLVYQRWHYQQRLVKREPLIQNSGATLAVKAGFKLHFPRLPWQLWEVIMKRGFSEQRCCTSGYYQSGLSTDHQRITGSWSFFLCFALNKILCFGAVLLLFKMLD